ncbi:MAG: hypothetical protein V4538_15175 [Bacteroidota bacterium]
MNIKELRELLANAPDDMDLDSILIKKEEVTNIISSDIATTIPIDTTFTSIKHTCNLGDIIGALPQCKKYFEVTGRKILFLQRLNMPAAYYTGAVHGTVDESGIMVTLNRPLFDMVKPLLDSQEYIQSMEIYNGQSVHLDFDVIRGKTFVNMPHGSLASWLTFAFPDLHYDISKPWVHLPQEKIQIEEVTKGKIVVNFTERYRNGLMDYFFLKNYAPDLIFAGTETEYFKFCNQWQLTIPRLEIKNFLELAHALRGCRFLLSNQSFQWNLATALGVPRVLEVCQYAQNCLPFYGEDNYGFFHQVGLEYYFRMMYNKTA